MKQDKMDRITLIRKAMEARKNAYSPYSHYQVGAALLSEDGVMTTGCNIENAAYSPGSCAERTAFCKAVSEGIQNFSAIAIAGGRKDAQELDMAFPCGVCRQVMMEFCNPKEFQVIVAKDETQYEQYTLEELLPNGFGAANLE